MSAASLPGANANIDDFAKRRGLPLKAARGGARLRRRICENDKFQVPSSK